MKKPNFLIIGAQKAGTTTLHHVLKKHPEIFMPEEKEIGFFFKEKLYKKGISHYEKYFDSASYEHKAIGEATPSYCMKLKTIERIKQYNSDMKLVFILRNPIDRAYSQYWHNRRKLSEPHPFEEVLKDNLEEDYLQTSRGYFSRGVYINQIHNILKCFPKDQLLILFFDNLKSEPNHLFQDLCKFLNLDFKPEFFSNLTKENQSIFFDNPAFRWLFHNPSYTKFIPKKVRSLTMKFGKSVPFRYEEMDRNTYNSLIKFFTPSIIALEKYVNKDLSHWLKNR